MTLTLVEPITVASLRRQGYPEAAARSHPGLRPSRQAPPAERAPAARPDPAQVRAWAREHDVPCPLKGRVPSKVMARYLAEH